MTEGEAKVLSYGDVYLRALDLELLESGQWLNDALIGFYFEYLQKECINESKFLRLEPSITFWLANIVDHTELDQTVEQLKLKERDVVLFAINDNQDLERYGGGTHWSLLAFFRGRKNKEDRFVHYDSAGGSNNEQAQHLTSLLSKAILGYQMNVVIETSPQQMNGWDCGVYVIGIAKCVGKWYTATIKESDGRTLGSLIKEYVTPDHMSALRNETKCLILELAALEAEHEGSTAHSKT